MFYQNQLLVSLEISESLSYIAPLRTMKDILRKANLSGSQKLKLFFKDASDNKFYGVFSIDLDSDEY